MPAPLQHCIPDANVLCRIPGTRNVRCCMVRMPDTAEKVAKHDTESYLLLDVMYNGITDGAALMTR